MKWCQLSFFDESQRHRKLDKLNDPLVELKAYVDFELFRGALERVFEKPRQSKVGHSQTGNTTFRRAAAAKTSAMIAQPLPFISGRGSKLPCMANRLTGT
ncbi:MAG TPA: hypothetical protein PKX94_07615 [Opitutales bacterium]|nr:hypothetical protein [Opitutales bacterium]